MAEAYKATRCPNGAGGRANGRRGPGGGLKPQTGCGRERGRALRTCVGGQVEGRTRRQVVAEAWSGGALRRQGEGQTRGRSKPLALRPAGLTALGSRRLQAAQGNRLCARATSRARRRDPRSAWLVGPARRTSRSSRARGSAWGGGGVQASVSSTNKWLLSQPHHCAFSCSTSSALAPLFL